MKKKEREDLNIILNYAVDEAIRTGCREIDIDHIILAAIRHGNNSAYRFFEENHLPIENIREKLNRHCDKGCILEQSEQKTMEQSKDLTALIDALPASRIPSIMDLVKTAVRMDCTYFSDLMHEFGISSADFETRGEWEENDGEGEDPEVFHEFGSGEESEADEEEEEMPAAPAEGESLINFGFDLTGAAEEGKLDPVIGREKEIQRILQILGRRKKNNPLLVGEAGVGKSSIVEAIAIKIAQKEVPLNLLDKRIISLDLGSVVAGTKFRGQFESRIKRILKEVRENPQIILFIDELHTIVGAGNAQGTLDAAEMLKPALARGEFQCIGTTTLDEYRNIIEKDAALARRFQKVLVEASTKEETLNILMQIKGNYEKFHRVTYTPEAIRACIDLSSRYISDRNLPDKAIDIMDEAGAKKHIQHRQLPESIRRMRDEIAVLKQEKGRAADKGNLERTVRLWETEKDIRGKLQEELDSFSTKENRKVKKVTEQDICRILSEITGIPLDKIAMSESNRLLTMNRTLSRKVVGQDEAIEKLSNAIKRNRAGLRDPNRPIGSFLFLGPTGVGKTYLAKKLAEFLFDREDTIIRIDMSEYMEKHSLSRLIGAPPGYIGYDEGGELSEKVRHKPYSVVLLDEVEKAHPDLFNLLLQVLDEGRLTDSSGRFVNFKNTVLILTSNIGSRELVDFGNGIGYASPEAQSETRKTRDRSILDKALKKSFSPEFLNRLDDVIQFRNLDRDDIRKIVQIEIEELRKRIGNAGYRLVLSAGAVDFLSKMAFDSRFGARPLKRVIQRNVEDLVSDLILSGLKKNETVSLVLNREKNGLEVAAPRKS